MNFDVDKDFALLYGIMLGDGCLSLVKRKNRIAKSKFISIKGSLKDDIPFFENIIAPILMKFRNKPTNIKIRKIDNSIEFNFTDIKLFDLIRSLFAKTQEAKIRGYTAGRYSFNLSGGRCEACKGQGIKKVEMSFLPDMYISCEDCKGKRYNKATLETIYKEKNISDVLDMHIEDAYRFFINIPKIEHILKTLNDVGLGYIKLGQSSTSLSGGEAQRIKLAAELSKRATGKTLYILDEPTTGLHFHDIQQLLKILHRLVDMENTVLVIEHNMEVIKTADFIIDLGPEGGGKGGEIVATGIPEQVAKNPLSHTGKFLKKYLETN